MAQHIVTTAKAHYIKCKPKLNENFIVNDTEIMSEEEMRREIVTYEDLQFPDTFECIKWLASRKLLYNTFMCVDCDLEMVLYKRSDFSDGFGWRCRQCASIRSASFFQRSRLKLDQLVRMVYAWAIDTPQKQIRQENELNSNHTAIVWCSFCRYVCEQYLIDSSLPVGGLNEDYTAKVVEVQVARLFERRYRNEKPWRSEHWVFGGVERDSGKCFMVEVLDRTADTLTDIIRTYILPGTIIVSVDKKAYYSSMAGIDGGIYEHQVITREIRDPDDHSVKNLWMQAKEKLRRQCGTSDAHFPSYLNEFLWRYRFKNSNVFSEFLICVRRQYLLESNT